MFNKAGITNGDLLRLIVLGVLVIIEGLAVVSVVLNLVFIPINPITTIYPNIASVSLLILPVIIGAIARRIEVAIVLTATPFFVLALVYTTVFAPVWNIDLFQLGTLAGRVASALLLLGGLGAFGWLIRRIFLRSARLNAKAALNQ
ncbi:MAG TPA: hypothetical protein VF812_07430 [Ktedonobacterales bacterium]